MPAHVCVRNHGMRERVLDKNNFLIGFERRPTHGDRGRPRSTMQVSCDLSKAQPQPGEAIGIRFLPGACVKVIEVMQRTTRMKQFVACLTTLRGVTERVERAAAKRKAVAAPRPAQREILPQISCQINERAP